METARGLRARHAVVFRGWRNGMKLDKNKMARRSLSRAVRAMAEALEPRRLLAAVTWTGAGDGISWTDASNWSGSALPGSADDVTISVGGSPTIQVSTGTQSIHSL